MSHPMTTGKQAQSSSGWRAWRQHCQPSLPKELYSQTGTTNRNFFFFFFETNKKQIWNKERKKRMKKRKRRDTGDERRSGFFFFLREQKRSKAKGGRKLVRGRGENSGTRTREAEWGFCTRWGDGVIVTTISHLCFVLFITFVTFAVATLLFVIVYSYTYTI